MQDQKQSPGALELGQMANNHWRECFDKALVFGNWLVPLFTIVAADVAGMPAAEQTLPFVATPSAAGAVVYAALTVREALQAKSLERRATTVGYY